MRSKLLRALAHLKAASAHVEEARAILRSGYMQNMDTSVSAVVPTLDSVMKIVWAEYGRICFRNLLPAKLPK